MIRKRLLNLLAGNAAFKREIAENDGIFCRIIGYEGLKRTFLRSLSSKEPVHILAMLHDSLRVLVYANSKQLARSFD
jgi:hypothetical protein